MTWYECHIGKDSRVQGGYPVIEGTRTPVRSIVALAGDLASPDEEEVRRTLPHLSLEQIRAALAYYADNPDLVDEDTRRQQSAAEAFLSRS